MKSLLLEPEIAAERGRMTAGLSSLTPELRAERTYRERQREKGRRIVQDAEGKEKASRAADGKRPRDIKDASGWPLQPDELIRRISLLTRKLYFEPSIHDPSRMGIYLLTNDPENPKRYIAAFHANQPVPEFTLFEDKDQRMVAKLMGWRSVLARLVRERIITKAQVEVTFGPPRMDSANWKSLTT